MDPTSPERREWLQSAAALALGGAPAAGPGLAAPLPTKRTPGRPGDFDFLTGDWSIRHQRLLEGGRWDAFEGEATCFRILDGVGSVEELRIPARGFSGMGLRLLDLKQQLWVDHWVNAKSGVLTLPGMAGSFEDGAGLFEADDEDDGRPLKVRGVWDQISARSCRWQQASSRDGGRSWVLNWSMLWTRAG